MTTKYTVCLSSEERNLLETMTKKGKHNASKTLQARALLLCDADENGPSWKVDKISEALGISPGTINNLKKRVVMVGVEAAFERKQREKPPREIKYDGNFDAHVIALACSDPPPGRQRWTVRLLAKNIVELGITPEASIMSIQRSLKKMNYSLIEKNTEKFLQRRMQPL